MQVVSTNTTFKTPSLVSTNIGKEDNLSVDTVPQIEASVVTTNTIKKPISNAMVSFIY